MPARRNRSVKSVNAQISELLIRAYNASCGGKGLTAIGSSSKSLADNSGGYEIKKSCITAALDLIDKRQSNYAYCVIPDERYHGKRSRFVVTFQSIIDGKKCQVSFHNFGLEGYVKESSVKRDHNKRAADETVRLYNYYVPKGTYV